MQIPQFASPEDEVRFLRGLVSVQRLADDILEDCLVRRLGLSAAVDVYLAQCARMIHALGGFVQLRGTTGPVLTRVLGPTVLPIESVMGREGPVPIDGRRTLFVSQLDLAELNLGALGFVLEGQFAESHSTVTALVETIAEVLDGMVLAFLAVAEGLNPLQRLDELCEKTSFQPRARIGKYELVTPLGTGGMAQVLVARADGPSGVGRLVALKRILPHLSTEPLVVQQFLDEARIGMRLAHPNLVTFHDFGQAAGGSYFMTMELVRGVDFDQLIYSPMGRLSPQLAVAVISQALDGLHAAHELKGEDGVGLGLVHRDLSPHNLMVGFDGRVKVLDFGVAKSRSQRTITLPGTVKGKPLYMSPEQAVGDRVDRRSDLFTVGLMLYEAMTQSRPFNRGDDGATMRAIVREPLARPDAIPLPLWEVMGRVLDKRPEYRPRTALELAAQLREAVTPVSDFELGRLISEQFVTHREKYRLWEQLAEQAAQAPEAAIDTVRTQV